MKIVNTILLIIYFSFMSFAQTNVDKLVKQLELLSSAKYDDWKYTTDYPVDMNEISSFDYDDSGWKDLKLDERIYPDSCILRKIIEFPEFLAGHRVEGKMNLLLSVDDFGDLYVNNEFKGHIPWSGEYLLTENAKPGNKFVIVIRAGNTGGPLRLIEAQLDFNKGKDVNNFILSLKTGQKLLSSDTYQINARVKVDPGIDKTEMDKNEKEKLYNLLQESVTKIDIEALRKGETEKFFASVNKVRNELKPVGAFAKRFTLQFAANAHIDAAWLWRKKETVEVCNKTFSSVMNMYDARQDFTYTQSAAVYYDWMQKLYPELFKKIKQKYDEGLWEITGGQWVEIDCNLPDGISWARQFLYAQKYFEENFGSKAVVGWNPDSFGYNGNMPAFLLNAGIDAFITQKISWNDTNVFPYRVFWWQAPDASKVLAYFPFDYVNEISNPFQFAEWMRMFEANTGFTKMLVLFGVGDHGGGPSIEMMERIDQLKELDIYPEIKFGTAGSYIDWLKEQDLSGLPTWDDELYLEYHRGTLTTQGKTKEWNRKGEVLLANAEMFNSFADVLGKKYEDNDLEEAWKKVLFNQFHDILPGSSIREVYIDSDKDYEEADKIGEHVLNSSLNYLAGQVNTSKITDGEPLVIFNPLSWQRTDVASVKLPYADNSDYSIFNSAGHEIPSQIVDVSKYERELLFIAKEIPPLGYKTYVLKKQKASEFESKLWLLDESVTTGIAEYPFRKPDMGIENEFFIVKVDGDSGWVRSIIDKRNGKELLTAAGNRLQILEDKPSAWDAWNIGLTGIEYPSQFNRLEVVEQGPVRIVLRAYRDYLKPGVTKSYPTEYFPSSFATQDIILYNGIDRIDFKTDVDWWEEKTMLKTAFPFNVQNDFATYEIPYGTIKRSTTLEKPLDKGKWEVAGLRFADLSDNEYGISLLNKSKYGYDTKQNVMRLSLLRSPNWPDPTADRGFHSIEYALYPHEGTCLEGNAVHKGYEYNKPLLSVLTGNHEGEFPAEYSFLKVGPGNVVVTSIKKAYDGSNAFVMQMYESQGKKAEVNIELPLEPAKVMFTNFLEENGEEISFNGNKINFEIKPNEIKTVKLYIE